MSLENLVDDLVVKRVGGNDSGFGKTVVE